MNSQPAAAANSPGHAHDHGPNQLPVLRISVAASNVAADREILLAEPWPNYYHFKLRATVRGVSITTST